MVLGYIVLLVLLVWRVVVLMKQESAINQGILRYYALPLAVAIVVAAAISVPFFSGYPEGAGFPLTLRRVYVLSGNLMYGFVAAALFYLFLTSQRRKEPEQIKWSLIAIFAVATLVIATTILGALYDHRFAGYYFTWDRPHTTRFFLFWICALSFFFALLRTFRYRSGSITSSYWAEPIVLVVGITAKILAAIFSGPVLDTLTWL